MEFHPPSIHVARLCIGLIATIISDAVLVSLLHWIVRLDSGLAQFISQRNIAIMAVSVLVFALTITLFCTYISVTRFLRMREHDLYYK